MHLRRQARIVMLVVLGDELIDEIELLLITNLVIEPSHELFVFHG